MNEQTRLTIKKYIKSKIESKFSNFKSETEYKPFFQGLFTPTQILTGSIVQSVYTTFGMSFYEQIAVILGRSVGFTVERQYNLVGEIDSTTSNLISTYWENLKTSLKSQGKGKNKKAPDNTMVPNKISEIQMIKDSIQQGRDLTDGDSTVDIFIRKPDGTEYYIDITTVKNNLKGFQSLKLKMLRWVALRMSIDKSVNINTMVAIPYNPYHPEPYDRWNCTILDSPNELLVQERFWNLVGNDPNTFNELIDILSEVGDELREMIDNFFIN